MLSLLLACAEDPDFGGQVGGAPPACERPQQREKLGPGWIAEGGPDWAAQLPPGEDEARRGAGLAVADFDGDGALDVFLPSFSACQLLLGDGALGFTDASGRLPLPTDEDCHAWGAMAGDVDADGDPDLVVTRVGYHELLWKNEGGSFVDATSEAGLGDGVQQSMSATLADIDGDGDLDLFFANHSDRAAHSAAGEGAPDTLWINDGAGHFTDVSERLLQTEPFGFAFIGQILDMNLDSYPDLYVVNDFGPEVEPNRYLSNLGDGTFELVTRNGLDISGEAMGVAAAWLGQDAVPDLAVSDQQKLHLLTSADGELWWDEAASRGLTILPTQETSWGIHWADLDNDGDDDLLVGWGQTESNFEHGKFKDQPDSFFLQEDGQFTEVGEAWGLDDPGNARGLVVADLDDDGWLEVITRDYRQGPARLWTSRCGEENWLKVDLAGPLSNPDGIGAWVSVEADGAVQRRVILAGGQSLGSSGPPVAHFGLGPASEVDAVEVGWPDGRTTRVEDVGAGQTLTVEWTDTM